MQRAPRAEGQDEQRLARLVVHDVGVALDLAADALEHGGVVERVVEVDLLPGGDLVLGGVAGQPLEHVRLARTRLCDQVDGTETPEIGRKTMSIAWFSVRETRVDLE